MTRLVVNNKLLDKLGPPFAFTLWVSARLLLVHGSTIAHTVSPDFTFFVDTLAQMGTYWKVAERYSSILQRVLDEYGEYQQSGATDGERATPSTVKILADMRRCAFDLDFLISRQPRSSPASSSQPPMSTTSAGPLRSLAPNELEYLDVFGFFNVPRVPPTRALDMGNLDIEEETGSNNPTSIHGLTGIAALAEEAPTDSSNMNDLNITNYLIPTPETDWLFRQTG